MANKITFGLRNVHYSIATISSTTGTWSWATPVALPGAQEFSSEVDLIVLDGDKKNASPSTIIKIENDEIKILRQGSLIIPE